MNVECLWDFSHYVLSLRVNGNWDASRFRDDSFGILAQCVEEIVRGADGWMTCERNFRNGGKDVNVNFIVARGKSREM